MHSYFVYNGINSRDMGVYLDAPAPVMRGKKRVTDVTVLGRSGTLSLSEGEDEEIYEPYTVGLILRARDSASRIYRWLQGQGTVTFSTEPDRVQKCSVVNQVQMKKISHHLNWYEGTVQFFCQPLKGALHEADESVAAGAYVTNLGDLIERPVITLTGGYGNINVGFKNGNTVTVLSIEGLAQSYGGCIVDCDAKMLLSLDGQTLLTNLTSGTFPFIKPGTAQFRISGSHYGTITIGRRQRWL